MLMRKNKGKRERVKVSKNPWDYVNSFSKIITVFWLFAWLETVIFSQFATWFSFGDATSIQYINENVRDIGAIICGFYFSTKCLENIAQGYEEWRTNMSHNNQDIQDDHEGDPEFLDLQI